MATIFVVLGGTIFVLGFRTYLDVTNQLSEEEIETTSSWYAGILTVALTTAAGLTLVLVFI
jgi:hypothetical protein